MKSNYSIRFITLTTVALLTFYCSYFTQAQKQQQELSNSGAADILPGARYVLEGHLTPYPAFVKFEEGTSIAQNEFFPLLKESLDISEEVDFVMLREETDELAITHYRYEQTYRGIPVDKAVCHVEVKDGSVISFNGEIYSMPDLSTQPSLTEEMALAYALDYTGASHFMWENSFWEEEIKRRTGDPDATYFPSGQLTWGRLVGSSDAYMNFALAYAFDIHAEDGSGAQEILVDANTGSVISTYALESNCSSASVTDIYRGGNRTIYTDKYTADDFRLKDDCQSASIRIRDWNSTTTSASPVEIENTTNTWNGTNDERFGATVLWHTKESYNYFLNVHGRNSYDNSNGDVEGYINAVFGCNPPPTPCYYTDNASMSFSGGTMKVGFGSGGTLGDTWGSLDIIAHEYTHAVTGSSSQLVYQDESGALNESFSDIFGEAVERRTFSTNDWLVGDDRTSGAIRSMSNPNAGSDPDTYLGTFWKTTGAGQPDNGGVHSNSGVQNYWFYLLGVGNGTVTTGTNDNGDDFSVTGIGFNAARAIAYRNNVVKLTSGSNYAAARAGAIAAAEDLYGACSQQVIQVKNAWYAVGVGTPGGPTFNTYNTSPAVCSGVPFSIDLQSYRTANFVTPIYRWFASYPAGISGGNGDCLGNACGTSINETLYNNSSVPLTVTYTLTRVDYDGCRLPSFSISKVINPRPTVANATSNILCSGDPFSISLQNAVTNGVPANFTWTVNYNGLTGGSGAGTGDFINETLTNNTGAGASAVYTVTAYSESGSCQGNSFTVTVSVPPVLTLTAYATSNYNGYNVSCFGGSDGEAEAYPVGGTPPYYYSWDDPTGQSTKVATGLMATTYNVTVTDANGCSATASATLTEPPQLSIDAGENQTVYYGYPPAECADLSWSGASGGVPPYSYEWSTGETSQTITVCPGENTTEYSVTITDANNCTFTDFVTVCVIDVRCGNNLNKVELCHVPPDNPDNPITICVGVNAVADHLSHGDMLAACGTDHSCPPVKEAPVAGTDQTIQNELKAFPNPFMHSTTVSFTSATTGRVILKLFDLTGRELQVLFDQTAEAGRTYDVNVSSNLLKTGMNYCIMQLPDGSVKTQKLIVDR